VIIEGFLHLFVNRHNVIQRISLFLFTLVNDLKLDFIQSFSVVDDTLVGFVELTKSLSSIRNYRLFVRMDKFGLATICCADVEV
jgi:hypothetical protein